MHHRPALCTTKSNFAMWFCTGVHFGSAQRSFVPIRWCTRRFCMFVICLSGFVRATLCTTSRVQDYVVLHRPALCTTKLRCTLWCTRTMLETTDLHCTPPICVVRHGAQGGHMSHKGDLCLSEAAPETQYSQRPILFRWCTT